MENVKFVPKEINLGLFGTKGLQRRLEGYGAAFNSLKNFIHISLEPFRGDRS